MRNPQRAQRLTGDIKVIEKRRFEQRQRYWHAHSTQYGCSLRAQNRKRRELCFRHNLEIIHDSELGEARR